jgi:AcrR family transcriptional regulator
VTRVIVLPVRSALDADALEGKRGHRRAAQREATRSRLFDETVKEFTRRGFADTEIAVITERVGLSRGAFYVHFKGKDEVLRELLISEEPALADAARAVTGPDASLTEVFRAVVDAVLAAERRLGRSLVRDLCAAQFRAEFAALFSVDDHPLGLMLVEEIAGRAPDADPVDLAMVFLTGLFGLLATDDASAADRRRRLELLIQIVSEPGTRSGVPSPRRT